MRDDDIFDYGDDDAPTSWEEVDSSDDDIAMTYEEQDFGYQSDPPFEDEVEESPVEEEVKDEQEKSCDVSVPEKKHEEAQEETLEPEVKQGIILTFDTKKETEEKQNDDEKAKESSKKIFEDLKKDLSSSIKVTKPKNDSRIAVLEPEIKKEKDIDVSKMLDELKLDEKPAISFSAKQIEKFANETLVVIMKDGENPLNPEKVKICGKTLIDFVKIASQGCEIKVIEKPTDEEFLPVLKMISNGKRNLVVLYADTPLLRAQSFLEIVDFFEKKNLFVLRLARGYVFKSDYLREMTSLMSARYEKLAEDEFLCVDSPAKVSVAMQIMQKRILDFHKENGVIIYGENTVFIDADVDIEPNVIIEPNVVIKNNSSIRAGAKICAFSVVDGSIISENAIIDHAHIEHSIIHRNQMVLPFTYIKNKE